MTARNCPCSRPALDAFVCESCLNMLDLLLASMTWHDQQLEATLTRQRGAATEGGSRSTETPIPWHDGASKRRRALRTVLAKYVRALGGTVTDRATVPTLAAWLLERLDRLAAQDEGATAYAAMRELTSAVKAARSVIFWKPAPRVYLGGCDGREATDDEAEDAERDDAGLLVMPCEGDVYAEESDETGGCQECGRKVSVSVRRRRMEAELDGRLYTASEIADLSTHLGLDLPRERVRKQIDSWHHRGRIAAAGTQAHGSKSRFKYGDVKPLLYALASRI